MNKIATLKNVDLEKLDPSIFPNSVYLKDYGLIVYPQTNKAQFQKIVSDLNDGILPVSGSAWADGSGTTANKPGGIGVYLEIPNQAPKFISENVGNGTNNRAELLAVYRVLREFPWVNARVDIFTDSQYARDILTKDWEAQANQDLVKTIREDLAIRGGVTISHVYGHNGTKGNEIADRLAKIGRTLVTDVTKYPGHIE